MMNSSGTVANFGCGHGVRKVPEVHAFLVYGDIGLPFTGASEEVDAREPCFIVSSFFGVISILGFTALPTTIAVCPLVRAM
jgi:hypothetical protein